MSSLFGGNPSDRLEPLALSAGEIHVWHARLDSPDVQLQSLEKLLNEEELERANRFRFPHGRAHFVAARGILRCLAGAYQALSPAAVMLKYSPSGKPALQEDDDLQFNLSHSHGLAVYAFARGRRIGIDVELVRNLQEPEAIVERFFSQQESAAFSALSAEAQLRGFFNAWARKEAFVKALGEGLGHSLASFSVSLTPGEPARFTHLPADQLSADWRLYDLAVDAAYTCALVAEGGEAHVVRRTWPGPATLTRSVSED
jgi:4'-phosphopantetheinyl transferase